MNSKTISPRVFVSGGSLLLSAILLGGCGGGGADDVLAGTAAPAADTGSVPDSAAASTQALVAYELGLAPDDRSEPLKLGNLKLPTDDRAEPIPFGT